MCRAASWFSIVQYVGMRSSSRRSLSLFDRITMNLAPKFSSKLSRQNSGCLHLDAAWLDLRSLGQHDFQHSIVELRGDALMIDFVTEDE